MKYIVGIILSVFVGVFIGFFGALLSVFTDGSLNERLVVIALVLLVYFAVGGIFGFLLSRYSWKWGLYIGVPAVLILVFYSWDEFNIYYFIYMALILSLSCLGAWAGSLFKRRYIE